MPAYMFMCDVHGVHEDFRRMADAGSVAFCPECGEESVRVFTAPSIRVINTPRLRYGSGSPGKVIPSSETGGLDIFIPSDGALEQAEVDDVAGLAVEKERARVKSKKRQGAHDENHARIIDYTNMALRAKPGQRAKTIRQAIKESGDRVRNNLGQIA